MRERRSSTSACGTLIVNGRNAVSPIALSIVLVMSFLLGLWRRSAASRADKKKFAGT